MANIDQYLRIIKKAQFGEDNRMAIYHALKLIADETPDIDPSEIPNYTFIVDNEDSYMIASDGAYAIAKNSDWHYVVASDGAYITTDENEYLIALG